MAGGLLILAIAMAVLVAAPVAAFVALARVRRLERRIADLEAQRGQAGAPAVGAAAAVAVIPPLVSGASVAVSGTPAAVAIPPASLSESTPDPEAAAAPSLPPGQPKAPRVPSAAVRTSAEWESLIAGRWLNRIGLLAVAIGVSYFLKYAIDNEWIGPRGQVAIGLLLGAALVAWSARFHRTGLRYFADGLAGLGAAVMFLSLWAGGSYYRLMSPAVAFGAMAAVTAAMLLVALGRNSQTVAVLAMIGGFLAPWLVSTGRDAHVVLFTYLAIHNAALVALARARDWRWLELPAFAFTQIYLWNWHGRFYAEPLLWRAAAFSTLFFALFTAVPVIRLRRFGTLHPEQGMLVLANAAVYLLFLRELLWPDHRWALTLAALGLAVVHLALARSAPARAEDGDRARVLFAGIALTCVTIVLAIRLDGHWITLAWAIEAAILMWSGLSTRTWYLRAAGFAIFGVVGLRLAGSPLAATEFLFNARLATSLIVAACAAASVWFARKYRAAVSPMEGTGFSALAVAANVLIVWALTQEVELYFAAGPDASSGQRDYLLARGLTISLLWAAYAGALVAIGVRLASAPFRWQGLALLGLTTVKVFVSDLDSLRGIYRIASSLALGVVLIIVSFLYQRTLAARREERAADEGP